MYFEWDTFVLDAAQAVCVGAARRRPAGVPAAADRAAAGRSSAPVSVVLSVVAIAAVSTSADVITWIALLLVPPGCALALGWAAHGARPWMAIGVVPLLAVAMAAPDDPLGRVARLLLIIGSCVTLGRLLAGATPLLFLKLGVVAMTVIDAVFIFGDLWGDQNAAFNAAAPAEQLPRLQVADIGDVSTDYGDYFISGVGRRDPRRRATQPGARGARHAGRARGLEPALRRGRLAARHGAAHRRDARLRGLAALGRAPAPRPGLDGQDPVEREQDAERDEPEGEQAGRPAENAAARAVEPARRPQRP